ncbi:MobA/MobL family protein [Rhizobium leguminosarum]|uniref:MobA/MobL family protein n=1 Tax=Rhizobium leguminosarum TaxID=384 RepID=UPI001C90154B|nr:MobA/MobL family protein [Rhizobium leguminosarum]MBY2985661.1 MobA/MobL family protein [Rhizobium leguminosarum]
MAIYHLHVKNISRGEGRSILAAAAYRAGETLPNELEERMSVFGGRRDVVANEIRLPQGAPSWMAERAQLWNAVETAEKRKDARLAKELEFSLPRELPRSTWLAVARAMADACTAKGFIADLAIHDDGTQQNPHVHLLLTTRVVTAQGFGPKIRSADGRAFVIESRTLWAKVANAALSKAGIALTIDNRSYAKRQLEQVVGTHRGPDRDERQARRARLQQRRPQMLPRDTEEDLPVPDPDGNPIHPRELAAAENSMVDVMHAAEAGRAGSQMGDIEAARAAVDRQSAREMSDDEAWAYRLAPENLLDWVGSPTPPQDASDLEALERWENHLDWLEIEQQPAAPTDEGISHEPERGRR